MLFFYVFHELSGTERFHATIRQFYETFSGQASIDDFLLIVRRENPDLPADFFYEWIDSDKSSELLLSELSLQDIVERYRKK